MVSFGALCVRPWIVCDERSEDVKKGITVEYNMQEDCYEVVKARGVLNMDEIQEAMTERYLCSAGHLLW